MKRASWLALILAGLAAALIAVGGSVGSRRPGPGQVITAEFSRPLGTARNLEASIHLGSGRLRIETVDSADAFKARCTHSSRIRTRVDYTDGRLRMSQQQVGFGPFLVTVNECAVQVTHRVPLELELGVSSGQAEVDLSGMQGTATVTVSSGRVRLTVARSAGIDRLEIRVRSGTIETSGLGRAGAREIETRISSGRVVLDFTGARRGTTAVEARASSGTITCVVPSGVGTRIRVPKSDVSRLQAPGLRQTGPEEFVNDAWATASARLDVSASVSSGTIRLETGPAVR